MPIVGTNDNDRECCLFEDMAGGEELLVVVVVVTVVRLGVVWLMSVFSCCSLSWC